MKLALMHFRKYIFYIIIPISTIDILPISIIDIITISIIDILPISITISHTEASGSVSSLS